MRYKVGDEVVLRDDIKVGNSYGDVYVSEELQSAIGGSMEILEKGSSFPKRYYVANGNSFSSISDTMIDHEKTATLNRENYAKYMEEQINDPAYQELLKELSKPVVDTVNHPPHYTQGDIETIDIIKILTQGYTGYEGSLVGNVIKYLARANFKGNKAEDIQKSQFYLDKLVEEIEK